MLFVKYFQRGDGNSLYYDEIFSDYVLGMFFFIKPIFQSGWWKILQLINRRGKHEEISKIDSWGAVLTYYMYALENNLFLEKLLEIFGFRDFIRLNAGNWLSEL